MTPIRRPAVLRGSIRLPADKSISHRALIANALAEGEAVVTCRSAGGDVLSTARALRTLGAEVDQADSDGVTTFAIRGRGSERETARLEGPDVTVECGNSGTTMRLLAGVAATLPRRVTSTGDPSLSRRPMDRVAAPLRAMGAAVETTDGHAPIVIRGKRPLRALRHDLPVASAQVLGAISFAALAAEGVTTVRTPAPTRDHTERMLAWMGARIARDGNETTIEGPAALTARSLAVPGDPSSAAAWLVAASLHPDADLVLERVSVNPTRLALVEVLREMGAAIEIGPPDAEGPEEVADVRVRTPDRLRAIHLGGALVAELIDELPLLGVAMAAADGESALRDAGELRVKESDRISAVVAGLAAIGAQVEELPDGWRVRRGAPRAAGIATRGDHRIAMSFAIAALAGVAGELVLDDPACVDISYPTFWRDLAAISGSEPILAGARA